MNTCLRLLPLVGSLAVLAACDSAPNSAAAAANAANALNKKTTVGEVLPETASSKDFGNYIVHFNALTTDQLSPEMAKRYGITRGPDEVMLNVSILRKSGDSRGVPVTGKVDVSAVNLAAQFQRLPVREVKEGKAVYYLAETQITDSETLVFTVDVTPVDEPETYHVRFQKSFYVD